MIKVSFLFLFLLIIIIGVKSQADSLTTARSVDAIASTEAKAIETAKIKIASLFQSRITIHNQKHNGISDFNISETAGVDVRILDIQTEILKDNKYKVTLLYALDALDALTLADKVSCDSLPYLDRYVVETLFETEDNMCFDVEVQGKEILYLKDNKVETYYMTRKDIQKLFEEDKKKNGAGASHFVENVEASRIYRATAGHLEFSDIALSYIESLGNIKYISILVAFSDGEVATLDDSIPIQDIINKEYNMDDVVFNNPELVERSEYIFVVYTSDKLSTRFPRLSNRSWRNPLSETMEPLLRIMMETPHDTYVFREAPLSTIK